MFEQVTPKMLQEDFEGLEALLSEVSRQTHQTSLGFLRGITSKSNTVHVHVTLAATLLQVLRCEEKERAVVEGTYHTGHGLHGGPCCSILGLFSFLIEWKPTSREALVLLYSRTPRHSQYDI